MQLTISYVVQRAFIVMFFVAVFGVSYLRAEESRFRKQFIENYKTNSLQAQSILIKQNKDKIADEVNSLINEAMLPEKNYQDRMYLLDIANAIATMNIHWNNGDEELLKKVDKLQKEEFAKEKKKIEGLEKLKETERVPGNFILSVRKEEMAVRGLSPVLYPHWIHRAFFRCKVCHEDIFIMKRGANDISQAKIQEGKQCGACHNGAISFNANAQENCVRCHIVGKPDAKPLVDLSYYNPNKFKEIASRVGSEWKPENMPGGKLPLDKMGFVNWVELDKIKAFGPRTAINGSQDTEGVRETSILFETSSTFLKNVLFSHKIHSTWVKCSLCHPNVFKPELGANMIKMIEMKDGKSCGRCHGKVAFTYSDCLRCHNYTNENLPEGALINRAITAAPAQ
ncbi:MAG: cytochrome c3 family protein [Deltaproteobacteria bacterium]|nr:cytochrome c3 family protein [Deltaproteobacteria bacterium]